MPIKPHTSHIAWQSRSWRLRVDTLVLPDGSTLERGIIEHPGAVVLVPLQERDGQPEIMMLHQYRAAFDETILELPAGTRGWDEAWLVCAQRELQEETGCRAAQFTDLGEIWPTPGLSSEVMHLYLATGLTADPLPADADEEISVHPMLLSELMEMVKNGRLHDAKTIIGVLKTAEFLHK